MNFDKITRTIESAKNIGKKTAHQWSILLSKIYKNSPVLFQRDCKASKHGLIVWFRMIGLCMLMVLFSACGGNGNGSGNKASNIRANGETNWMSQCKTSADCGDALNCQCGVCTQTCDSDDRGPCANPDGADGNVESICVEVNDLTANDVCAVVKVVQICLPSCQRLGCPEGLQCRNDICIGTPDEVSTSSTSTDVSNAETIGNGNDKQQSVIDSGTNTSGDEPILSELSAPLTLPARPPATAWGTMDRLEHSTATATENMDIYAYATDMDDIGNIVACYRKRSDPGSIWCARYTVVDRKWSPATERYRFLPGNTEHHPLDSPLAVKTNDHGDILIIWQEQYEKPPVQALPPGEPSKTGMTIETRTPYKLTALFFDANTQSWTTPKPVSESFYKSVSPRVSLNETGGAVVSWSIVNEGLFFSIFERAKQEWSEERQLSGGRLVIRTINSNEALAIARGDQAEASWGDRNVVLSNVWMSGVAIREDGEAYAVGLKGDPSAKKATLVYRVRPAGKKHWGPIQYPDVTFDSDYDRPRRDNVYPSRDEELRVVPQIGRLPIIIWRNDHRRFALDLEGETPEADTTTTGESYADTPIFKPIELVELRESGSGKRGIDSPLVAYNQLGYISMYWGEEERINQGRDFRAKYYTVDYNPYIGWSSKRDLFAQPVGEVTEAGIFKLLMAKRSNRAFFFSQFAWRGSDEPSYYQIAHKH